MRRIKRYVLTRLRQELAEAPRGAQAKLAKRLGVSGSHISSMLMPTPSREPGESFRRKMAKYWGLSYAQLETLAQGEPPAGGRPRPTRDDVPPNFAAVTAQYVWMHELPQDLQPGQTVALPYSVASATHRAPPSGARLH